MDYYNFDPNIADNLLDFEVLPLQTRFENFYPAHADGQSLVRDSFDLDTLYERSANRLQVQTVSSTYLKNSKDLEIINQYSELTFEDYPNKNTPYKQKSPLRHPKQPTRHRQVIRVTVIPTNTAYKKRRIQRCKNKKLQTTVSNQETCIKATNVFLVLGQEREKVHGVRSSGSEVSKSHEIHGKNEAVVVEDNLQTLLKSLDMDGKKKKKGKKEKGEKDEENFSLLDVFEASDSPKLSLLKECMCPAENANVNNRRSRVRISGKIGRTEDDRYVLKCNATIDGKPVETGIEQPRYSQSPPRCPAWKSPEPEEYENKCPGDGLCHKDWQRKVASKEAFAQANITFEEPHVLTCSAFATPCPAFRKPCPANSKPCPALRSAETQCGPTSFNAVCISNIEKLKIISSTRDEYMQCNCIPESNPTNIGVGTEFDKTMNSPLVIISVYPKSTDKMPDDNSVTAEQPDSSVEKVPKQKGKKGKKKEGGARSRSASPSKTPSKSKADKAPKGKKEKGGTDNKAAKSKKGGKKEKEPKGVKKEKSRSPSPDRQSLQSGQKSPPFSRAGVGGGRCTECCIGCTGMTGQAHKGEQTRSRQQAKRMMNWVSAKDEDESNVAININGENEFYDVVFKQGGMSTDVRVRKTKLKGKPSARNDIDTLSDSLENFLLLAEDQKEKRRSFSQTFLLQNDLPIDGSGVNQEQMPAPLKVRDSIEISHRREEKASDSSVNISDSSSSSSAKIHFEIAAESSVKHYQGDDCDIGNPVQRDKEIRELLGIDKPRPSRLSQMPRKYARENNSHIISHHSNGNHRIKKEFNMVNTSTATDFQHSLTQQTSRPFIQQYNITKMDSEQIKRPYTDHNNKMDLNQFSKNTTNTDKTEENTSSKNITSTFNTKDVNFIVAKAPTSFNAESSCQSMLNVTTDLSSLKISSASTTFKSTSSTSFQSQRINSCGYSWQRAMDQKQDLQQVWGKLPREYKWEPASDSRSRHGTDPHMYPTFEPQQKKTTTRVQQDGSEHFIPKHYFSLQTYQIRKNYTKTQVRQMIQQTQQFVPTSSGYAQTHPTPTEDNQRYFWTKSADQRKNPKHIQNVLLHSRLNKVKQNKSLLQGNEKLIRTGDSFSKQRQITSDHRCYTSVKELQQHNMRYIPEIYLQLEQYSKKKPIVLTRKQYARMKRILENASPKKYCYITKRPSVTLGEVRSKRIGKIPPVLSCKGNQCEKRKCEIKLLSPQKLQSKEQITEFHWTKPAGDKTKCLGEGDSRLIPTATGKRKSTTIGTPCYVSYINVKNNVSETSLTSKYESSSTEFSRTGVKYKHVSYSTMDVRQNEQKPSLVKKILKNSSSIHTIFKGPRNMCSPNLGTSAYSLRSDYTDANSKSQLDLQFKDQKPRKPFLRRLMSCLVMRSKVDAVKVDTLRKQRCISNSTDWYHISTSLGAMELSSSLYDTSASFYSNHSIHPINSKIKSGFLKSVRVLLANRRT